MFLKSIKSLLLFCLCVQGVFSQTNPHGLFPVKKNGLWGLIDHTGQIRIQPLYQQLSDVQFGNFIIAELNNKIGIIDIKGNVIVEPSFEVIIILDSLSFIASNDSLYSLYPIKGKGILQDKYENIKKLSDTLYITQKNGNIGLISNSREILPAIYNNISVSDTLIFHKSGLLWGCNTINGNILLNNDWDSLSRIMGFIVVEKDMKKALFSPWKKAFVSSHDFDSFRISGVGNKTYIYTIKANLVGLLNDTGARIISNEYQQIIPNILSSNEVESFLVKKNNKWGVVNLKGNNVLQTVYDNISFFEGSLYEVEKNNLFGVFNRSGRELYPVKADRIRFSDNNIKINDKNALIIIDVDNQGNETERFRYENVSTINVDYRMYFKAPLVRTAQLSNDTTPDINLSYGWFRAEENKRWGLKDTIQNVRIQPIFQRISDVENSSYTIGVLEVRTSNRFSSAGRKMHNKLALIDKFQFRMIAAPEYDFLETKNLNEDNGCHYIVGIKENGLFEYIQNGHRNKVYSYIGGCNNGYARVNFKGKMSVTFKSEVSISSTERHLRRLFLARSPDNTFPLSASQTFRSNKWIQIRGGRWGMINGNGELTIPLEYGFVSDNINARVIAKNDTLWGVLSVEGDTVVPFQYDHIELLEKSADSLFLLKRENTKFGLMDSLGNLLTFCIFDNIYKFNDERALVRIDKKYGYIDKKGALAILPEYKYAKDFSEGLAAVRSKKMWGFVDTSGNMIIPMEYTLCGNFSDGLTWFSKKNKYGYINNEGVEVIPPIYDRAYDFLMGVAVVQKGRKKGVINKNNAYVVQSKYASISILQADSMIVCKKNNKNVFFDLSGNKTGKAKSKLIGEFSNGLASINQKGKFGFVNFKGELVVKPQYTKVMDFSNGLAGVCQNGKWGFINTLGELVIPLVYNSVISFTDTVTIVFQGRKTIIINRQGEQIKTYPQYKSQGFSNGYALLRSVRAGSVFYIDTEGKILYNNNFDATSPFTENLFFVRKWTDNKWHVADKDGRIKTSFYPKAEYTKDGTVYSYSMPRYINQGMSSYSIHTYYNVADYNGNLIFDAFFENIEYVGNNIFRVESLNKIGYINKEGVWLWYPQK